MKIVVYDIAAAGGGGTTILKQYIEKAKRDTENQWWFIVSLPGLQVDNSKNVHVLYQAELNKSGIKRWINRFFFEHFRLSGIISQINPDWVLSLQNMPMPKARGSQTVYLHQSLQFAPVKFSFLKNEERACAIRQRIICRLIQMNLRKADEVIVQTRWMKKATAQWTGIPEERIHVESPRMTEYAGSTKESAVRNPKLFFYPASGHIYKNHRIIIEACKLLKHDGIHDYHITFTLNPSENGFVKSLYDEVQREQLPISFIGFQNQEAVFAKYAEQTLLFPSYIETFGLPLQEAKAFNAPIIASDCPYAHDVLEGYDHCLFAKWNDAQAWADAMKKELSW